MKTESNIKDKIFFCPFCTFDISIINSYSHPSNSQIFMSTQCDNQSHKPYLQKEYNKYYNCLENCPNHSNRFIQFQCITCNTFMCSQCKDRHLKDENFHLVISQLTKTNSLCSEHHKPTQFYCKNCMNKICESCRKTTHKTHEVSEDLFQYMLFEKNGKLNEMKAMKTKQILQINSLIKSLLNVKNIIQQEIIDISEIMRNNETLLRKMKDFIVVDNYKPIKTMKTYQNKHTIDIHSKSIISIKEISNNRFLLSSSDNKIIIWDSIKNKSIGELNNLDAIGMFIPVLNDTRVAVVTRKKNISICDLESKQILFNLSQHNDLITSLNEITINNPHILLSSSFDGTVITFNLKTFTIINKILYPIKISKLIPFPDQSRFIFFSENSSNKNVIISNPSNLNQVEFLSSPQISGGFAFLKNQTIAMYNKNFEVVRLTLTSKTFTSFKGHTQKIVQMIPLNNNEVKEECVATLSLDRAIKVWNIIKGQLLYNINDINNPVKGLELSNGNIVVLYANRIVKIFKKNGLLHQIRGNDKEFITDMISLTNNNIALTTESGMIQIYY